MLTTEKRKVWIVTAFFADFENSGYLDPSEEFCVNTYAEAEKLRAELLEDPEYEDVWISDEPEEREFYVRLDDKIREAEKKKKEQEQERIKEDIAIGAVGGVAAAVGDKLDEMRGR